MNVCIWEWLTVTDLLKSLSSATIISDLSSAQHLNLKVWSFSYVGLKQGALVAAGETLNTATEI